MAMKMEYSIGKVKSLSVDDNPAGVVLEDWGTVDGNDLHKLIEILTDMGRDDVVEIIRDAWCKYIAQ